MKNNGFTLAEVLLTLGIVGVIATLTLPSLMSNTKTAQIGPKLAKAVAVFEQANEAFLNDSAVDRLSEACEVGQPEDHISYGKALGRYLKISQVEGNVFISKDGIKYTIGGPNIPSPATAPAHMQGVGLVSIDINGSAPPNEDATDIFYFTFWNDGSLRPIGAINWNGGADQDKEDCTETEIATNDPKCTAGKKNVGATDRDGGSEHWKTQCAIGTVPVTPSYCAGHVFENNLKVLYE